MWAFNHPPPSTSYIHAPYCASLPTLSRSQFSQAATSETRQGHPTQAFVSLAGSPQHVTPCSLLLTVCAPDVFYSCCSSHLKCTHIASPMLSEPRHTHTHTHTPLKAIPRPPTRSPRASQHFLCSWACNVTPTMTNIYNPLPRARLCTRFFSFHRLIQTAAV